MSADGHAVRPETDSRGPSHSAWASGNGRSRSPPKNRVGLVPRRASAEELAYRQLSARTGRRTYSPICICTHLSVRTDSGSAALSSAEALRRGVERPWGTSGMGYALATERKNA